jgi:hypothetical protein
MSPTIRLTIACVLAYALLAATISGPALARPTDGPPSSEVRTSSLAGTTSTPRQDLRNPDVRDAALAERRALAQESHYSSYGEPEPLPAPAPPGPTGDDTPWLPIAIAVAAILAIAAAGGAQLRIRRRRTAGAAV